jgi:hypothetical protein
MMEYTGKFTQLERQSGWYRKFRDQLGFISRKPGLPVELSDYKMYVHAKDPGVSRELVDYRVHEPQCSRLYRSLITSSDVIFDLGSNIGYYALMSAGQCKQVIAVEPVHENFNLLKSNIKNYIYT